MPRFKTSNCVSCLFWFGSDAIGILPILIGMKEAKQQRRSYPPRRTGGGEINKFESADEFKI